MKSEKQIQLHAHIFFDFISNSIDRLSKVVPTPQLRGTPLNGKNAVIGPVAVTTSFHILLTLSLN